MDCKDCDEKTVEVRSWKEDSKSWRRSLEAMTEERDKLREALALLGELQTYDHGGLEAVAASARPPVSLPLAKFVRVKKLTAGIGGK